MIHPDLLSDNAKERHQELIHKADQRRRLQRARRVRPRRLGRWRLHLGERLIAWGMQLKASAQPPVQLD
jgi:hypothetical protein